MNKKSAEPMKMSLALKWFELTRLGLKTVEVRLFDEKRQKIKLNERILFVCDQSDESVMARVTALYRFDSFLELGKSGLVNACGFKGMTPSEIQSLMRGFYSEEDEKRYGVLAIETEVEK